MKLSVESLKNGKLAPKNLKPLIKDLPNRITERADQVLLGLSHSKQSIPTLLKQTLQRIESNPADIVGRVSRQVLERAEIVRKQLIEKAEESETSARWVPDWLKEATFASSAQVGTPVATPVVATEAATGVTAEAVPADVLETKPKRAQALKTPKAKSTKESPKAKARGKKV